MACHRIFFVESGPLRFRGTMRLFVKPAHSPLLLPVDGRGCSFLNSLRVAAPRLLWLWLLVLLASAIENGREEKTTGKLGSKSTASSVALQTYVEC